MVFVWLIVLSFDLDCFESSFFMPNFIRFLFAILLFGLIMLGILSYIAVLTRYLFLDWHIIFSIEFSNLPSMRLVFILYFSFSTLSPSLSTSLFYIPDLIWLPPNCYSSGLFLLFSFSLISIILALFYIFFLASFIFWTILGCSFIF